METIKKHSVDLHKEYLDWIARFKFYEEEMETLKSQIVDILTRNTDVNIAAVSEQLTNQLDIQRDNLQKIKDHLRHEEKKFSSMIQDRPEQYKHVFTQEELAGRNEIEYFEKQYPVLKAYVKQFLAKHL